MAKYINISDNDKVAAIKKEFIKLLSDIFHYPETIKKLEAENKIITEQIGYITKTVSSLNSKTCGCCKKFDEKKLVYPLSVEFEPLLKIAQETVKGN